MLIPEELLANFLEMLFMMMLLRDFCLIAQQIVAG